MLPLRDDDYIYRILAIDNGSSNLGEVVLDLDLRSGVYYLRHAQTFVSDRMITNNLHQGEVITHGARWARQCTLEDCVGDSLEVWEPDDVAVESPFFMPRRVQSFEVLTEMMVKIRQAVQRYSGRNISTVTPGEAKRAVQPRDKNFSMKKVVMRDCILRLTNLEIGDDIDINNLSEHEYDAISVGIAFGERVRKACGFVR
jgi:hypothetical protein